MGEGIRLRNVSRTYEGDGVPVNALSEITFAVPERSLWVVAGPSGSGKTTLLNLIGGMDRPTSGAITVGGHDLNSMDEQGMSLYRRFHVGFVFQGNNLIPMLTAFENIELPLLLTGENNAAQRVSEMLDRIGLGKRGNAFPNQLSGGEQQRVAIARALIHMPAIVLADEPTGNLDSKTGADIFQLIIELNSIVKTIILFATHDPFIIGRADNVLSIYDGRLSDPLEL